MTIAASIRLHVTAADGSDVGWLVLNTAQFVALPQVGSRVGHGGLGLGAAVFAGSTLSVEDVEHWPEVPVVGPEGGHEGPRDRWARVVVVLHGQLDPDVPEARQALLERAGAQGWTAQGWAVV